MCRTFPCKKAQEASTEGMEAANVSLALPDMNGLFCV